MLPVSHLIFLFRFRTAKTTLCILSLGFMKPIVQNYQNMMLVNFPGLRA